MGHFDISVNITDPTRQQYSDGADMAIQLFKQVVVRVPAYKKFLAKNKIDPEKINSHKDFQKLPFVDKSNYINRYSLEERSWDGKLDAKYIAMSSGSTGKPHYWARGAAQDEMMVFMLDRMLSIFEADKSQTLFLNSFGLGAWIAGLELNNALKQLTESNSNLTISSPSLDLSVAVRMLEELAPKFKKVVLAGYPPFVKDIVTHAKDKGINLRGLDLRLLTAGEAFSEKWRDGMVNLLEEKDPFHSIINYYGLAESGTSAHETPVSIALRRSLAELNKGEVFVRFGGTKTAGLYQFYPRMRFFEQNNDNVLLLTSPAGLPLVRYYTRDEGGVVDFDEVEQLAGDSYLEYVDSHANELSKWKLPFVYLFGRTDLSATLYAVNIYVENIKAVLEDPRLSRYTTGIYIMETKNKRNLDQFLEIQVELKKNVNKTKTLARKFEAVFVEALRDINTEYNKLYSSIGKKANPKIVLKGQGSIDYQPGRKHKWVKKD